MRRAEAEMEVPDAAWMQVGERLALMRCREELEKQIPPGWTVVNHGVRLDAERGVRVVTFALEAPDEPAPGGGT